MSYCPKCDKRWKSKVECHCSSCHKHFKSLSAFDKHFTGRGKFRRCMSASNMESEGMVFLSERGLWIGGAMPADREYKKAAPAGI